MRVRAYMTAPLLMVATGCGGDLVNFWLEIEPIEGARSMVVATEEVVEQTGRLQWVHALDLETGDGWEDLFDNRALASGTEIRVTRLGFSESLAELELTPDRFEGASEDAPLTRSLAGFSSGLSATIGEDLIADWQPIAELTPELSDFRYAVECAQFDGFATAVVTSTHSAGMLVRWSDDEVLVTGSAGGIWVIDTAGNVRVPPPFVPEGTRLSAGIAGPDGTLWLIDRRGGLWTLPADARDGEPASMIATFTSSSVEIRHIAGTFEASGNADEIIVMTAVGDVFRYADGSMTPIYTFRTAGSLEIDGGIAPIGPRKYFIGREDSDVLLEVSDGEVVSDAPLTGTGFTAMESLGDFGVVAAAGGRGEIVWVYRDGTWEELGTPPENKNTIRALIGYREGFLTGSVNGFVSQYRSPAGFCAVQLVGGLSPFFFAHLQDTWFLTGFARGDGLPVLLMRERMR